MTTTWDDPKKRIICLSGPPRAGKDEFTKAILKGIANVAHYKMSYPLKKSLPEMFGLNENMAKWCELNKETETNVLEGMTWRAAQIWLSEDVIKPNFGPNFFGRVAVRKIRAMKSPIVIISDSGFIDEIRVIKTAFGAKNMHIIRLSRDGCDFSNDSRSYLIDDEISSQEVHNRFDKETYHNQAVRAVNRWLNPESV